MTSRLQRYEMASVAILCLAWGVVQVDMIGINYLLPFIAPDLKLSNTHVGMLVSIYWIAFALSSYLTGMLSDRFGNRKSNLLLILLLFSLASVLAGFSQSFQALLAARLLMGLLEGPIFPLAQSIIAMESSAERRGMNMGIVQCVGTSVLGWFVAPLLLVNLATHFGWRAGFFLVIAPGLICSALVGFLLREPPSQQIALADTSVERTGAAGLTAVLRYRNVWLCAAGAASFVAFTSIGAGFLPLFYTQVRGFLPQQMSLLMSVLGISGLLLGIFLPAISDRVGRKPVMLFGNLLGLACPLAVMYYSGPLPALALIMFLAWAPMGSGPLAFATIPSESVPAGSLSTAIGLILAVGTLVGGVIGPILAGWSADRWGPTLPMFMLIGWCAIAVLASLALRETAPKKAKGIAAAIQAH
jgi:MFS family permease